MKQLSYKLILFTLVLLPISPSVYSADFCVENRNQLYLALTAAESNNQDDHIKIAVGNYPIAVSSFVYDATGSQETNDLKISGGWTFFSVPCGQQLPTSNFDTILDGEDVNLILSIEMVGDADLEISDLFFFDGNGPSGNGGALRIEYPTGTDGDVLLERNLFVSNTGNAATALSVDIADTTTVRNNTFVNNNASISHIVRINSGANGIYFTNNTVVNSTNNDSNSRTAIYLQFPAPSQVFVANNVFWNNQDSDIGLYGTGYSYFKNNDYQDLATSESNVDEFSGNFTLDPQFQPIGPLNTHIPLASSPLINAGIKDPSIVGVPPDFDETWYVGDTGVYGNDRIIDGHIDIGAYEKSLESDIIFESGFE